MVLTKRKRKEEMKINKVSVNGFDIFYTRRLFQRLLAAPPIQQMRQLAARAHAQPLGDPFYRHRRFHPQPLRQPHFENVSIAPHPQVVLSPPFAFESPPMIFSARASALSCNSSP